jgi:hypothetical protein
LFKNKDLRCASEVMHEKRPARELPFQGAAQGRAMAVGRALAYA